MRPYEKIYKELSQRLSDEEIADGYLIPADLSAEESAAAEAELRCILLEAPKQPHRIHPLTQTPHS